MDIFEKCQEINQHIINKDEFTARNELIKLLDYHHLENILYSPLVNNLIRQVGLYPYLQIDTANWQDRFVFESFKVNVGEKEDLTLHREQSLILKKLIEGKNLAISAPTSFGKSFIIDSFIALNRPENVLIIVPTIALMDETRRRLHKKFSRDYKIITTSEVKLSERNIFIFPQERATHYAKKIENIDILIIDEFYKASSHFDKERSPSLINAMLKLGVKAKQKYFLAPNISKINDGFLTKDMEFESVNFNTVYLEKHNLYEQIGLNDDLKSDTLINILRKTNGKTLIYAGTYSAISDVSNLLISEYPASSSSILRDFELWLIKNYSRNWKLTNLVKRGSGIHNGRLHRSLSQIQVRLFEEPEGLKNLVSTSSIIEGVNTSAENVIIWKNKNGKSNLTDFTYKNIIGRGGRMFKHFIGKIYILEKPPEPNETQLNLVFPDELLGSIDLEEYKQELTKEQIYKIIAYKEEMKSLLGDDQLEKLYEMGEIESSNSFLIRDIVKEIKYNKEKWSGLVYLNSPHPKDWEYILYQVIGRISRGGWGIEHRKLVEFIKILSNNWNETIPDLLDKLDFHDIGIDDFFHLERNVTFKLATILSDINVIQKNIFKEGIDISPFITKVANAFLPPLVYQLEEYGLPRMLSRMIHNSGIIDMENDKNELHDILNSFVDMSIEDRVTLHSKFDSFDKYIFNYFLEGISTE
ncbi:DEAD/DEAH box helicase [Xenorhabdus budapestensis]|uniref:Reverse gyrase n=1 Tax=Xenorhabdus budapestensis TaxID=290110 RepID=A0A2D0IRA0_XENBU|nr:DEAD/DEAH box helicase [Xenorhabdus budapestensis]PHM24323.1 Reverse gyrase [Xenorhabdus budapestensis]